MIRTVLGDIRRDELGITMAHEHFIIDLDRIRHDKVSLIETADEVVPEIRKMMDLGVNSAFEVTTIDMRRDVIKLRQISELTALNIVASTGFYLNEYHPDYLKNLSADEIADIYEKELTVGIDGTDIRAGLIAEIASSPEGFLGQEKKILEAAGIAAARTGAAVSTHTSQANGIETIETLLKQGMNPDRIIIGHQDLIDDHQHHMNLLSYGVNLGFDTCGKTAYQPDEVRAENIMKIIEKGYGDHVVLSNDVSRRTYFTAFGQSGYLAVMKTVAVLLKKNGISQQDLDKLLIHNPARIADNEWNRGGR